LSTGPELTAPIGHLKRPSAFGDWRRAGRLVWILAKTEVRQRYANSMLGYLWTALEPLLFWAVLYVVMDRVLLYGGQIDHYASFLLMNVVLFWFFRDATGRGFRTVRRRGGGLVRKMEFPRAVLPISTVVSFALIYLGGVPLIFGFLVFSGVEPMWTWLLFPFILLILFLFTCATALLLAAIYAYVADIEHIWRSAIRIGFWITPVFYAIETIPGLRLRDLILTNPLAVIFEQARIWLIDPAAPGVAEVAGSSGPVLVAGVIFFAVCILGPLAFALAAPRVAERL
jgi:ABC-2 type transport system permease protein